MFHILGIIFFIIIFVLIIGFTIVYKIVRTVLNVGKSGKTKEKNFGFEGNKTDFTASQKKTSNVKKKVFDDNEGEYIEFEEIKD